MCSAGALVAMEHMGFTGLFDEVYGTSAGVMNACYFLTGQAALGIRIYYEDMIRREIVNPLRVWKIFAVDRLFDTVVLANKRLRLQDILDSRSRLFIAMLDVATAEPVMVEARAAGPRLLDALRASTALPVFFNRVVEVDGRPCMDAGLAKIFPLDDALAAGCTDILVLLSHEESYRRPRPGPMARWMFNRICARGNCALAQVYARCDQGDARLRALALGRAPVPTGVNIATLVPGASAAVTRLTASPATLHAAAVAAGENALRAFGWGGSAWVLPSPAE